MTEFMSSPNGLITGSNALPEMMATQKSPTGGGLGSSPMTNTQIDTLSRDTLNAQNQTNIGVSFWEKLGRGTVGVGIDLADSVWSSPINPAQLFTDTERGDVWALASPKERAFYERNKEGIEAGSAIVGGLAAALTAEAIVIPRIASALASSTAITGTRAWQASRGWNITARREALEATVNAAKDGRSINMWNDATIAKMVAKQSATTALTVTRTLPFDYAVMWNNEAFNSGDIETEAFWIALGGGVGGAIGGVMGRAGARRMANSPEARSAAMEAFPMAGSTQALLDGPLQTPSNNVRTGALELKDSTEVTFHLIASRAQEPGGMDASAAIRTQTSSLRQGALNLAKDAVGRMTARGITGIPNSGKNLRNAPEVIHLTDEIAKDDPTVLYGFTELGMPVENMKATLTQRAENLDLEMKKAQELINSPKASEGRRLAAMTKRRQEEEAFAFAAGTWMDPQSPLVSAIQNFNDDAVRQGTRIENETATIPTADRSNKITLDGTLTPRRIGKDSRPLAVEKMHIGDRLNLWAGARQLVNKLASKNAKSTFILNASTANNWFALDLADEILERGGQIRYQHKTIVSRDELQRESLRLKSRKLLAEVGQSGEITAEMRLKYNLPAPTPMEALEDPAGDAFRRFLMSAAADGGTAIEMTKALKASRVINGHDLLPSSTSATKTADSRLHGDAINFNRDTQGRWLRPLLGFSTPRSLMGTIANRGHIEQMQIAKAETFSILTDQSRGAPITNFATQLVNSPDMAEAHRVNQLLDGQNTGLGNPLAQAAGEILPRRTLSRDNKTILAAGNLHTRAMREADASYRTLLEQTGLQKANELLSRPEAAAQRAEMSQYMSLRPGWDIESTTEVAAGRYGFVLADSDTNRRMLGVDKVEKGTVMPNLRTGRDITVGEEVLGIIEGPWKTMTDALLRNTNAVRAASGRMPIAQKAYFVPAQATRDRLIGFLQDPSGKIVPGRTINAGTPEEYKALEARTLEEFGDGYTVTSREAMEQLRDKWDDVDIGWVDHGVSTTTAGIGRQSGGLTGAYIREGAFTDTLNWARESLQVQHRDVLRETLRHPIQIARLRSSSQRLAEGGLKSSRNIFDEYENALLGYSANHRETATISNVSREIEHQIDRAMQGVAGSVVGTATREVSRHIADMASRLRVPTSKLRGVKTYEDIQKVLGEHSPFRTQQEFLESHNMRMPSELRKHSNTLNRWATNVVLRWDVQHSVMNMLGLIPTLAGNLSAGGAPMSAVMRAHGKNVGVVDSMRIMKESIGDLFDPKRAADRAEMVRNGDASQSAIEYHDTVGAITSQQGLEGFLAKSSKYLGYLTDKSENFSRQLAHTTGLRLADYQGIQGMTARHNFAREFADAAIADYTPTNRPEFYQTAIGGVFGLFQSYIVNQYAKMFTWVERGQFRAAGTQAAVQMSLFGVSGTYGSEAVFGLYDRALADKPGEMHLMDNLYSRFGPELGGAIAHGGIAGLTDIALYTRGDVNVRLPIGGQMPAGIDVLRRASNMVTSTIQTVLTQQPEDMIPVIMENVSREMPNRIMRGVLTMMNEGEEVDRAGRIVTDTRNWMEGVIRVSGVRSARQQSEIEAYYMGVADMQKDAARMERVRTAVRTAARDGATVDYGRFFEDYLNAGGNPTRYGTWVKQNLRTATEVRTQSSLRKSMAAPSNRLNAWRYQAYGAWPVSAEDRANAGSLR